MGDSEQHKAVWDYLVRSATQNVTFIHRAPNSRDDTPAGLTLLGLPRLSLSLEWPRSSSTGQPLVFLGEIDLELLPNFSERHLLPSGGGLHFFVDLSNDPYNGHFEGAVKYSTECLQNLPCRIPPEIRSDPVDLAHMYSDGPFVPSRKIGLKLDPRVVESYQLGWTVREVSTTGVNPHDIWLDLQRPAYERTFGLPQPPKGLTPTELRSWEIYLPPHLPIRALKLGRHFLTDVTRFQLLGHGQLDLVDYRKDLAVDDLIMFFQFPSDRHSGFQWGDLWDLTFLISASDLRRRIFDKAFVELVMM
jgi:hypothetical protein